jgi:hypothetical protein
MRCAHCGLENIDSFVAEAFDGWNWVYVCGPGHLRECHERAKKKEENLNEHWHREAQASLLSGNKEGKHE